jgi:hypothetical protein
MITFAILLIVAAFIIAIVGIRRGDAGAVGIALLLVIVVELYRLLGR